MSDRFVIVRVTDPRTELLDVREVREWEDMARHQIPVPEDDTLLQDIDYVTTFVEVMSPNVIENGGDEVTEAAAALRARFHLDDEQ